MKNETIINNLRDLMINAGATKVGFSMPSSLMGSKYVDMPYAITVVVRLSKK